MAIHAVLGAAGAVGQATLAALQSRNLEARPLRQSDADARDADELIEVLSGADYVYHCIGLPYNAATWEAGFPVISSALVEACEKVDAKLIYLDNAYLYGPPPLPIPFDENTPRNPTSRKGQTRKKAVDIVRQAHDEGRVPVTVGRAADFYGPGAFNSPFFVSFLELMLKGKAPTVIMPSGPTHSYAYTLDIGKALVTLALDESAYGEEFHLPVGSPVTVDEIAGLFNQAMETDFTVRHMPQAMLWILSKFIPILREVDEMNYQFKTDYVMSDDKFRQRYPGFQTTNYADGTRAMVESFRAILG